MSHDSTPALPARAPSPTFGEEHNNDVDYNGDSPDEEGSTTLESSAKLIEDRNEPGDKGKEEAEPARGCYKHGRWYHCETQRSADTGNRIRLGGL
jgi:hypothetical protein